MLVFICPRESNIETDGICDELSSSFFGCFGGQIISAWAVGGEVFSNLNIKILAYSKMYTNNCIQDYVFPNGVAFPLGGKGQPFKILLEVHFDNPNNVNG